MSLKLLKFDVIHPIEYLHQKKKEWGDLDQLSHHQYLERLMKLRSNYSDFYTFHLNGLGWEAEEFVMMDGTFYNKVAQKLYGSKFYPKKIKSKLKDKWKPERKRWEKQVILDYVNEFKPDVIFLRSHPLDSEWWHLNFRHKALIVGRLSARLPFQWHPNHFDLLYTDQTDFQTFFELHGVPTILNKQGYDQRINSELINRPKKFDISFVGGMGMQNFRKRTQFFNDIAQNIEDFQWWGYWFTDGGDGSRLGDFPALEKSFHGVTSGLEMFQTFKDTKINLNDYVDTARGMGFNQRMFEVMGTGSFLLTREAHNFKSTFPNDIFITYQNDKDCLDKIDYFLKNEKEREEIAENAAKFIAKNYGYKEIAADFDRDLRTALEKRNAG